MEYTSPELSLAIVICIAAGFPPSESDYFKLLNAYVGKYEQQYYPMLRWNGSDPEVYRTLEVCHC